MVYECCRVREQQQSKTPRKLFFLLAIAINNITITKLKFVFLAACKWHPAKSECTPIKISSRRHQKSSWLHEIIQTKGKAELNLKFHCKD